MKNLILTLSALCLAVLSLGQGATIDFGTSDANQYSSWSNKITVSKLEDTLYADVNNAGNAYDGFNVIFDTPIDLSTFSIVSLVVESNANVNIRVDLVDENGNSTNDDPQIKGLSGGNIKDTLSFDLRGKLSQSWPSAAVVDGSKIAELAVFFNPGQSNVTADVYIHEIGLGDEAFTEPGYSTKGIHLNQIGFYPVSSKMAIISESDSSNFYVVDTQSQDSVFTASLSAVKYWELAGDYTKQADFSSFETEGEYYITSGGLQSPTFVIGDNIHEEVAKASLKAFYFNRCSMELESQYAGKWARPLGHPDYRVYVHPSAATTIRPSETLIASPKGWYDAGDYNKYIVNSGITTYTLLAAYEHFSSYYDQLELNIPESGNNIPDLIEEIKWNLDWMLTMQDPNDGGVYFKCTSANFTGKLLPHQADGAKRWVIQKSTGATLDFAAVMAVAYRVFSNFESDFPGYADKCLTASWGAWHWAKNNPDIFYDQDDMNAAFSPSIHTGGYGDWSFQDEFTWAAAELLISTGDETMVSEISMRDFGTPGWQNVGQLAFISLNHHKGALPASINTTVVDGYVSSLGVSIDNKISNNPYNTAMGSESWNFNWGSNGIASNQGFLLLQNYFLSNEEKYLGYALSNVDYLLGRNPLGQSYITGYGSKPPMNIHHRPSEGDNNADPVPGFVAGGPNPGQQDGCIGYPSSLAALSYLDEECSYSTNEIAINWNAPAAYLLNAVEAIKGGYTKEVKAFPTGKIGGPMTGFRTAKNDLNINLYPNPTTDVVYLSERVDEVVVYSVLGETLMQLTNVETLSLTGLATGTYILELRKGDTRARKTIVKN